MRLTAAFARIVPMLPVVALVAALLGHPHASAADLPMSGVLYKDPACGCCAAWGEYMRANGFEVEIVNTADLASIKHAHGIPADYEGCHTFVIGGYAVEGHVPVAAILKLLTEEPDVRAISLPGMPMGSPGMGGSKEAPFAIYAIGEGDPTVYYEE